MPLLRDDVEQSDRILTFNEIFLSRLKDISPLARLTRPSPSA